VAELSDGDQLRFDFRGRWQGQIVVTTYMYRFVLPRVPPGFRGQPNPNVPIPPELQECGRRIHDFLELRYRGCMHTGVVMEKWVISNLNRDRSLREQWTEPMTGVGLVGGTALPPQNCAIIRRLTTRLARELNGYICVPGIVVEAVNQGRFVVGHQQWSNLVDYANILSTQIRSIPWMLVPQVIAFRRRTGVGRYPGADLRSAVPRSVVRVRRSRGLGHGRSG
jgi:hypothetical protein